MRFRVTHLLILMLVVVLVAAKESIEPTADFITQAIWAMVFGSLVVQTYFDRSTSLFLLAAICLLAWPMAGYYYISIPMGLAIGMYLARRTHEARPTI